MDQSGATAPERAAPEPVGTEPPPAEVRRVVEPDLLWIESVTDRLLGTAGRSAAWERVYFEDREIAEAAQPVEPAGESFPATAADVPAPETDAPTAAGDTLPRRPARDVGGPVSYRQPAGYVPPASVESLTAGGPASTTEDRGVTEPDPQPKEPPVSAEPAADLAPAEPHPDDSPDPAEAARPEDMPPAVLRAALRDALPDVLDLPAASGPADAVFGDPRWNLPAEEDDEDAGSTDLAGEDAERLREAAATGAGADERDGRYADEPVRSPYFDPPAPRRPRTTPSYANLGYGFPRPAEQLTASDVALRLAFRSGDGELAEAVVRLVARQAHEGSRLQTAEAYLDALLDEGDGALPGAARLRHLLAD